jgi:nucleoside-diphosphate-sugar epimerase
VESRVVLVTGATGFVGRALPPVLRQRGYRVWAGVRGTGPEDGQWDKTFPLGPLESSTDVTLPEGIDTLVHLAARVHQLRDRASDLLADYRLVNVEGTSRLLDAARKASVRRFIFLSSVKVSGERSEGRALTEDTPPNPEDAYGLSKREAEDRVRASGLEFTIIRPPLVYGPGVKANFLKLMKLVDRGIPLPFGSVENRRSFVYLGNLVEAISSCIESPGAAHETFFVSDGRAVSTTELIRLMGQALGKRARLLPVPAGLLRMGARLANRSSVADRLLESLEVSDQHLRTRVGWSPRYSLEAGLAETARWYRSLK